MRVVVTGATGNVGTSVVEALVAEPKVDTIVGVARRRPRWSPPKTSWAAADVAEDDLVAIFDGADAVVHLAWMFQPTHNPAKTWRTNVIGSERVFSAAAAAGVRTLVHASSVGAYAIGPESGAAVDESWPTRALPTAAYGREKSYVERVLDVVERDHPGLLSPPARLSGRFTLSRRPMVGPRVDMGSRNGARRGEGRQSPCNRLDWWCWRAAWVPLCGRRRVRSRWWCSAV